jgi:hypothetical protein
VIRAVLLFVLAIAAGVTGMWQDTLMSATGWVGVAVLLGAWSEGMYQDWCAYRDGIYEARAYR